MNISSTEINLIQQVHNRVHNLNIDLPSITVVGPQSSGKSSVLESLINKDILPRGINLVTRCPIILHLKKTRNEEYVELNSKKYILKKTNESIKNKIFKLMDKMCGTEREITNNPIIINLWLKDTLEFTIVDLPGITKVAIGKQSEDIESKILNMVREYITPKNTILLAIINSNVDISNSEALKVCKEVDPDFKRTIGVVTKIDLMDKGTDCVDILENKTYPLSLGFVGVINRSQQDIKNNITLQGFRKKEKEFFKRGEYKNLKNTGCHFLLNNISALYQNKVKDIFPIIKEELRHKLKEKQSDVYVDTFILRYKYHLVLTRLTTQDNKHTDLFSYSGTNIILNLNTFRGLKVTYDFLGIKNMLSTDLSIFINDNILITIIKDNMKIIKKSVLVLQDQYKNILIEKIQQIHSDRFPGVCKEFNDSIIAEIESWSLEDKISEYIDVISNVIGNTDLFFKTAVSPSLFGTHLCLKGGSKEEILRDFSKMYLDKQINNVIEYSLKLNYHKITELIEKSSMECISKVNIEGIEEMMKYMISRNEDSKNIIEALSILNTK